MWDCSGSEENMVTSHLSYFFSTMQDSTCYNTNCPKEEKEMKSTTMYGWYLLILALSNVFLPTSKDSNLWVIFQRLPLICMHAELQTKQKPVYTPPSAHELFKV